MKHFLFLFLLVTPFIVLSQELKLADVFTDNMVLQRDEMVPVWGQAKPHSKVIVSFKKQVKITVSDKTGNWKIVFDELQTSTVPEKLTVTCREENIVLKNVLVGEVWLCSGQSNMFWPVGYNEEEIVINGQKKLRSHPGIFNYENEIKEADYPLLRLYYFPEHRYHKKAGWEVCSPKNIGAFSATAYFFGRELLNHLKNVPVGLVAISAGGSSIQKWMTKESALKSHLILEEIESGNTFYNNQGILFEKFIQPVVPYAIKGFVWYQGESNSMHRKEDALAYEELLELLIDGWRNAWNKPEARFYFAQLPVWENEKAQWWHVTRESMRRVQNSVKHTGMAVLYDFCDTENLHPPEKQETGRRLALWALNRDYGFSVVPSGPVFKNANIEKDKIICYFDFAKGLKLTGRTDGFQIINRDGKSVDAEVAIEGNYIVLKRTFNEKAISFFYEKKSGETFSGSYK